MKYQSTRGGQVGLSFEDVVMSGYATDYGMYMPMEIPKLSQDTLEQWSQLSYIDIMKELAKIFVGDEVPAEKISELIDAGFTTFKDPANPIVTRHLSGGVTLLEMFHGQSMAFKDLSMCCAAEFIRYFLEKSGSRLTILLATSGDTGSSALKAMSAVEEVDIVVLLPKGRTSEVQERQMTTIVSDNCHVIRADGTSDDTDVPIRKIASDADVSKKYRIGSLNSVNWCRLMAQMAHNVFAYFEGQRQDANKETVVFIPTGGLGNATGACIVREMGVPIRLVCSVTNDALYRALYDNDYSIASVVESLAPAMNIQVIYNFERLLYIMSGMDTEMVKQVQEQYEANNKASTPELVTDKLKAFMDVVTVSDDKIIEAMKRCNSENDGYVVCPHTATALAAAYDYESPNGSNMVVYGVASPAKFADALEKAGVTWNGRNLGEELKTKETRYTDWASDEDWCKNLVDLLELIDKRR